jgi:uncharacterized membrane protein YhaH (DUF805 family)
MEWMILPLKRCWEFDGRSRRKEYWMFFAGYLLAVMVAGFLGGLLHLHMTLVYLVMLVLAIPSISLQVRRFHDRNMSGWFVLLNAIPYLGGLIVLVFMALPGNVGPNDYGHDPKVEVDGDLADIFGG